jgi:hypothetical protein
MAKIKHIFRAGNYLMCKINYLPLFSFYQKPAQTTIFAVNGIRLPNAPERADFFMTARPRTQ